MLVVWFILTKFDSDFHTLADCFMLLPNTVSRPSQSHAFQHPKHSVARDQSVFRQASLQTSASLVALLSVTPAPHIFIISCPLSRLPGPNSAVTVEILMPARKHLRASHISARLMDVKFILFINCARSQSMEIAISCIVV